MFEKITNENVMLFALRHYDNPQCERERIHDQEVQVYKKITQNTDHDVRTVIT